MIYSNIYLKCVAAAIMSFCFAFAGQSDAKEAKLALHFTSGPEKSDLWNAATLGVMVKNYYPDNMKDGFIEDLGKAKLLVINRGAPDAATIFSDDKYKNAVSEFLKKGGILFFQYRTGGLYWTPGCPAREYLESIGVSMPGRPEGEGFTVQPTTADNPLLRRPIILSSIQNDLKLMAWGWFPEWDAAQIVLFSEQGRADHAALLAQDGVLGKGVVCFSRVVDLTRSQMSTRTARSFSKNLLTLAFGELEHGMPAAGMPEPRGLSKVESLAPSLEVNPLYFRGLLEKSWWHAGWAFRLPLLVHEPTGENRQAMTVNVRHDFPADAKRSSFRVVTPWGEEIASQSEIIDESANRHEITFQTDISGSDQQCYFIYFDTAEKPDPGYESTLRLREDGDTYIIENRKIMARLHKHMPAVLQIQPQGNFTGNQFEFKRDSATLLGSDDVGIGMTLEARAGQKIAHCTSCDFRVAADGPVRKCVEYRVEYTTEGNEPYTVIVNFALDADADVLSYTFRLENLPQSVYMKSLVSWMPGLGWSVDQPDELFFFTDNGVRAIPLADGATSMVLPLKDFIEGWYALRDTCTGQTVGEIFEMKDLGGISLRVSPHKWQYQFSCSFKRDNIERRGALVSLPCRSFYGDVRAAYERFKTPPTVLAAAVQEKSTVAAEPRRPVFGRDLLRGYHLGITGGSSLFVIHAAAGDMSAGVPELVLSAQRLGANFIPMFATYTVFPSKYDFGNFPAVTNFLPRLIKEAHAAGLALAMKPPAPDVCPLMKATGEELAPERGQRLGPDWLEYKDAIAEVYSEAAEYDVDIILLRDEKTYRLDLGSDYARQLFRDKYGMEPTESGMVVPAKLAEPVQHNMALFNIDAYTEILRTMAEAVRASNPDVYIGDQVNPSSMMTITSGAPHDWEQHADFLNTISMDLYGAPRDMYKHYIRFMRAMFNNAGPIIMISGSHYLSSSVATHLYPVMWGADALWHFPVAAKSVWDMADETQRTYFYLDYTGIGDMNVRAKPVKYAALLWNRAAMLECIRRGEWRRYEGRIQNISVLRNLPVDIVMSRYFNAATLKNYPALIVASDTTLTDDQVSVIARYCAAGGSAFIEGGCIENAAAAELCGVQNSGAPTRVKTACAGAAPFAFNGSFFSVQATSADIILRLENDQPALFSKMIGKGRVIYSPLVLSEKGASRDDVGGFYKWVLSELAGPPPITLDGESDLVMDSSIKSDGTNWILTLYNKTIAEREVEIKWNRNNIPSNIVSFSQGVIDPFDGQAWINVPAGQFRHVLLADSFTIPDYTTVPTTGAAGYSLAPGENLAAELPATESQNAQRLRRPGVTRVSILSDKGKESSLSSARIIGDEGIFSALREYKGLEVAFVYDINEGVLKECDVLIIPNIGSSNSSLTSGWERRVREFVLKGGAALLCHRSVGYAPCQVAPFPEIGQPAFDKVEVAQDMKVVTQHPVTTAETMKKRFPEDAANPAFDAQMDALAFKAGEIFKVGFVDYVPLKPGGSGTVLIKDAVGEGAVVIAGQAGNGRVALAGLALGVTFNGGLREQATEAEQRLIVNSVYWLAEREN